MSDGSPLRRERRAFAALAAFLLAPIIAQGLFGPLVHVFGPSGRSGSITGAALAIAVAIVFVRRLRYALAVGASVAVGATIGLSLGLPGLLALLGVATAIAPLVQWLHPRLPSVLDGLARRRPVLATLYVALSLSAVVSTARVSIFIGDSARVDQQALPGIEFLETHSCLTAYVHAASLSRRRVDNLYADRWWDGSHGLSPTSPDVAKPYRPFTLDYYAYPPPFLLVTAPLAPFEGDFAAQRALWFGLNGLLLAAGLWIVARWVEGPNDHRVLLLSPLFFGSLPVLVTLQVGNFQIAAVVISVLAMVALDRGRTKLGGGLLALAILSKLSPGILGVVLLAQRRWRAAAWAAAAGVVLSVLSMVTIGMGPTRHFLTYTLPRIKSGEAFAFLADAPFSIITNMAAFGLPFKLQLLGVSIVDPWALARRIGNVYSAVLLVLAVVAVRRRGDRRGQAMVWMSLLVLAALQSPFAPGYVSIGLLWATMLLAVEVGSVRGGLILTLVWLLIAIAPPFRTIPLLAAHSIFQSALIHGVPAWLILRDAIPPRDRLARRRVPAVE